MELQFALCQFVLKKLIEKKCTPLLVPTLVREEAMVGTGFFPAERAQNIQCKSR